jgi:hypothetical protein
MAIVKIPMDAKMDVAVQDEHGKDGAPWRNEGKLYITKI